MFTKFLIANRSEIACCVMLTARQKSIKPAALYPDAQNSRC